ncbi:hypothetical protein ACHAXA_005570 [Cyclostephanos tholiformis]|uniref:Adenosine 3'-phospho 5'-phosphosulfate transporter 1 n=1 Tax=Cyclostephanos tholiformis TaxID=382380 RepID=A0ABD3SGF8_9STRA
MPLAMDDRPLLSPTAESALLSLCTNFLLYVAMVLITIMVSRLYFPSLLEPREEPTTRMMSARMLYVRSVGSQSDDEEDDDGVDEEEDFIEAAGGGGGVGGVGGGGRGRWNDDNDGGYKDDVNLLDLDVDGRGGGENAGGDGHPPSPPHSRRSRMGSSFLEYDRRTMSRESVYTNLAICAVMLNVTFVSWGLLQERMLTRKYPRLTGEYFTYSYALVFTNRFWTMIMSGMLLVYLKPRTSRSTVIYEYCLPSISNMLSSWCQYEALRYVSFPAVTLFKSFKLAPVMLMGKLLGNHSCECGLCYIRRTSVCFHLMSRLDTNRKMSPLFCLVIIDPQYDYFVAIFTGIGIAMFMTSTDELKFDSDVYGEQSSAKWTGVMLLLLFLFFDSFTSQWQSRMFKRHRDLSMIELMFATSAFSTALSLITLLHDGMLWPAFAFISRHSEIQIHFFLFSICSTVGQLFIFYTIKNFGAVVFAIIMTARVLISIALSVTLYKHKVTSTGFFGLVVVVSAVCYRIKKKAEGRQLIKWQGMGEKSEKEIELVQEWHEHIDT